MFTAGVITASDKGSKGEREDRSGAIIVDRLKELGYEVVRYVVLPDDEETLASEMKYMADELDVNLILTTGGTGFSPRDVTPEATRKVITKEAMGIAEAILHFSLKITPRAMLSRAVSGIRNKTLIVNMPGSPKAVTEAMEFIMSSVEHGLNILLQRESECAAPFVKHEQR